MQCVSKISLIGLFVIMGCSAISPNEYKPLPRSEARYYTESDKDVTPSQVRADPARFGGTLVGWAGVIQQITFSRDDLSEVALINVDHHFFNWKEVGSGEDAKFIISPDGGGEFSAGWRIKSDQDKAFIKQFAAGDMIVAYGYPSIIRGDVVGLLPTRNIRAVKPAWYRVDPTQ